MSRLTGNLGLRGGRGAIRIIERTTRGWLFTGDRAAGGKKQSIKG
jgi:hypothetical protein